MGAHPITITISAASRITFHASKKRNNQMCHAMARAFRTIDRGPQRVRDKYAPTFPAMSAGLPRTAAASGRYGGGIPELVRLRQSGLKRIG